MHWHDHIHVHLPTILSILLINDTLFVLNEAFKNEAILISLGTQSSEININYWRCPHSMRCRVSLTVGCLYLDSSVCLSVPSTDICPVCRSLVAGSMYWSTDAGAAYRSITAVARAAAAVSVMLRAEVRGSTQTCYKIVSRPLSAYVCVCVIRKFRYFQQQRALPCNYSLANSGPKKILPRHVEWAQRVVNLVRQWITRPVFAP